MKLGISSYSLDREIAAGRMTLAEAIDFAARAGATCMELVPFAFRFDDAETGKINMEAIADVRRAARDAGVEICNYSVLADLLSDDPDTLGKAIAQVKHQVDIAAALQLPRMRHDISAFRRPLGENTLADFDRLLPRMVESAGEISEYARARGVKTMIENHGFFVNGCDRVERVLNGVHSDNYGLLLDTGNIVCVDEDATVAAQTLAPRADMVHLKDFYVRAIDPGDTTQFDCGGHWFRSRGGKYLRGAILNQGDLNIPACLSEIKRAGYDGHIVLEFEGLEDARYACMVGLKNARRIWDEA